MEPKFITIYKVMGTRFLTLGTTTTQIEKLGLPKGYGKSKEQAIDLEVAQLRQMMSVFENRIAKLEELKTKV